MYERLKFFAKRTIPNRLLERYDDEFRRLNAVWYSGDKVNCNCCGGRFSKWISLNNGELLCPRCGSLPRTRRLSQLLTDNYLREGLRMLHFSPSKTLHHQLSQKAGLIYDSTDFVGEFRAKYQFNILDIAAPDMTYDLVVCYHVLEHVEDDRRAMSELFRVLKPGGTLLVQTPFREGAIYEDRAIRTEAGRLTAFGQGDHVRVYSVAGLAERLERAGFATKPVTYAGDDEQGFRAKETVLHCTKS
jgi:hypothetical protein